MDFPLEIKNVDEKTTAEKMKYFSGQYSGYVHVGPKNYFMPAEYRKIAAEIYNMPVRKDDVFVITFPRTGTTMTQELVWLLTNDLDFEGAQKVHLDDRFPYVEFPCLLDPVLIDQLRLKFHNDNPKLEALKKFHVAVTDVLAASESPRFIKSHLPLSLLPPPLLDVARVVYVARDPRDVAVSFYHLTRLLGFYGYTGDFKTFWKFFTNDMLTWCPYIEHVKEAWNKRNHPNMLFLFYEDLRKDLANTIRRIASFFRKEVTETQVKYLCEYLSIDNFKRNSSVNPMSDNLGLGLTVPGEQPFIRRGKAGGWRDYFDEEMTAQAQNWIADNLRDTDLCFPPTCT